MKIKVKAILLITATVALSVIPLSLLVLLRIESVMTEKTYEVCRNLAENIANTSVEELLIDSTYDGTRTVISRLRNSEINGLEAAYVINIDGERVAALNPEQTGETVDPELLKYVHSLDELEMSEINKNGEILRFTYPIFINYKDEKLRAGAAVFEFGKAAVYEPISDIRSTIIYVASVVFIITVLIGLAAAIILTRPLSNLSEGAKRIGEGDLNHRITVKSTDEIGHLALAFNEMAEKIHDFTQNLENKVALRTRELNETLEKVKALKEKQDVDYYLTSLLVKPLQTDNNNLKEVKTDFHIEQFKKFKFQKSESEIGGDICITDSIRIGGRAYTIAVNADAMGKSIQGAGGALVLGAAFNAHLIQAKMNKASSQFPEIWLRDVYRDIHNIFVSFEGSMYISVFMALIDRDAGFMYYLNCDHPRTILYRDNRASFIDDSNLLSKLGTPDEDSNVIIQTFQLSEGDIIISGSDGRDDIMLKDESGNEYINEDQTMILRIVQDAQADLKEINRIIRKTGRPIDDISLLKLQYEKPSDKPVEDTVNRSVRTGISKATALIETGNLQKALEITEKLLKRAGTLPEVLKCSGRIYFNLGDYDKSVEYFTQYNQMVPQDHEYLYLLAESCRLAERYEDAADYAERLYLRQPDNVFNLINLGLIYREMGIYQRAISVIEKALDLDSDHPEALKIYGELRQKRPEYEKKLSQNMREEVYSILKETNKDYRQKKFHKALAKYRRILDLDESNPWALYRAGSCCKKLKQYDDSVIYYNRAILSRPDNYHARHNLGEVYFRQLSFSKARKQLEKALKIKPGAGKTKRLLEKVKNRDKSEN